MSVNLKIDITYNSIWGNSFLDGDNNSELPKRGRKFIGSVSALKNPDNFIKRDITHDTIMGVLNRLIGDKRKLWKARLSDDYYFHDIEPNVSFKNNVSVMSHEIVRLKNPSANKPSATAYSEAKHIPMFESDYSLELWGILNLTYDELFQFILDGSFKVDNADKFSRDMVINFLGEQKKIKTNSENFPEEVRARLTEIYPFLEVTNFENIYCASLYIQSERLSKKYDLSTLWSKQGGIPGISKKQLTPKDFARYCSPDGVCKKINGSPYIFKSKNSNNEYLRTLSGVVSITIKLTKEKASELLYLIDAAAVGCFPLGKKGLAYVSSYKIINLES